MARVVVLVGPPGSGKSTVGAALGLRGLRWRDHELMILERWGTRENFVAQKAAALQWLHDNTLHWIAGADTPAVVETTGLSDASLVDELDASGGAFVIRLDVSLAIGIGSPSSSVITRGAP